MCSDAAAEAARYGFTAVDRPEGFLVLAVASLGEEVTEFTNPPEDTKSLEEKKIGVKGLGRKKTEESEHFMWRDDIKVPCGRLVPSEHKDSPLEYNEYAVYDPKQVNMWPKLNLFILLTNGHLGGFVSLVYWLYLTDKYKVLGGSEVRGEGN